MDVRDLRTVEAVSSAPFEGYARRPEASGSALLNRVVACVALLSTMVLSGIYLGTPRPRNQLSR